jgi:hypothetical protein
MLLLPVRSLSLFRPRDNPCLAVIPPDTVAAHLERNCRWDLDLIVPTIHRSPWLHHLDGSSDSESVGTAQSKVDRKNLRPRSVRQSESSWKSGGVPLSIVFSNRYDIAVLCMYHILCTIVGLMRIFRQYSELVVK